MIDLNLFKNIMEEIRENSDLLDSLSPNQFNTKLKLIEHIKKLVPLEKEDDIAIFGCWYGSILIPAFYHEVKRITAIDLDPQVISRNKYRIYPGYKQIDFVSKDCFEWAEDSNRIKKTKLIINTSCEHMKPMRDLKILSEINSYFAFTSNDMYDIEGHINCVDTIEDFKKQLPDTATVLAEEKVTDYRGTRFLLIGKLETDTPAHYKE